MSDGFDNSDRIEELEAKNVELERKFKEAFESGQASAIPRMRELEKKLEIACDALEFYSSWKNYGGSRHPFLERYSAEIMLDSSEIEYTETDGDIFKETFAGKRARKALAAIKGASNE